MNKTIKGSIAGATGIALLMGGFGTYALWSDSENLAQSSVSSGVLTIDRNNDGAYANPSNLSDPSWEAGDLMVPGDVVTYTETFALSGTGKNLQGRVDFAPSALDNGFESGDLTRDIDISISGTDFTVDATDANEFTFDEPFTSATLTGVVTYDFVDAEGTESQGATATTTATPASTITISQN